MLVRDRVRDVVPHVLGGEPECRFEIDPVYIREVRPQQVLAGLPHEQTPAVREVAPGELNQPR